MTQTTTQPKPSRRSALKTLLSLPVAALAAGGTSLKGAHAIAIAPSKDVVRQSELQEILDLNKRADALAANVRRRLEAGAPLEHGKLGATNSGAMPVEWYEAPCSGENSGLRVEPVEELDFYEGSFVGLMRITWPGTEPIKDLTRRFGAKHAPKHPTAPPFPVRRLTEVNKIL
jgi:hypothetical protein